MFAAVNAELEASFAAARKAIADRAAGARLTPRQAEAALSRACALHRGSRLDRFPVLSSICWAEEAAVSTIGFGPITRKSRIASIKYDERRYGSRSRIEIMFGCLKDWRRVATRYDRCPNRLLLSRRARRHRHLLALIDES